MKHLWLTLTLLLLAALHCAAGSVRVQVIYPGRGQSAPVGETFYIEVTAENVKGEMAQPASVPGCKLLYFTPSYSSVFVSENGKTSHKTTTVYTLTLRAETEGKYSFGPVTVGGVKSNSVSYTVGAKGKAQQRQNTPSAQDADSSKGPEFIGTGNGNLFLRAAIDKTTAYEQEALVYTVKLYTSYDNLKFLGATDAPKFEGFVISESKDVSKSLTFETYQGKTYQTAVIARYIIFPQMTGTRKIVGNTYTVSVDEREFYSDPFFGTMPVSRPMQFDVRPNDLSITVKPLPSPRPADFTGAVGNFRLTSSLKSKTFKSNEPFELVYTATGEGNLKYVTAPELSGSFPQQLEVYSPAVKVSDEVGSSNVSGSVEFDYSVLPLEKGDFRIPPVSISYFNPKSGRYERTTAQGYNIHVEQGSGSAKSMRRQQLRFIPGLLPAGSPAKGATPYVYQFLYWLWFIIPAFLLILAVVIYGKYVKMNADIAAAKSRRANRLANKRLRKARQAMNKGDRQLFYTELLQSMYGYLGDKLSIPASELNRENVADILADKGVEFTNIDRLIKLLDEVEQSKYSPVETAVPMQKLLEDAAHLINSFQQQILRH